MAESHRDLHALSAEEHGRLAHLVMRRQAALSIRVAVIFLAMVFGLPLVNHYLPDLANTPVLGFTATWLFLGILFFPITWLLSAYFIRESDRLEDECQDWRAVLGVEAGEPLEPEGIGEIHPAFIEEDIPSSPQSGMKVSVTDKSPPFPSGEGVGGEENEERDA